MKKEKRAVITDEHEIYIRHLIAKNLRNLRSERHISQMELSSIADISTNFINEIENEKKSPSIKTLAKLVKALSVEPIYFFTSEIMLKNNNAEMLKVKLSGLFNTAVAELNETIDRYITDD